MNKNKVHILFIDDDPPNLMAFKTVYRRFFRVDTALSAAEGLKILNTHALTIKTIICDQRMPEMTGIEFFEHIKVKYPDISRIIATGYADIKAVVQAINQGKIYHYISKPWDEEEFKNIIFHAIEACELKQENKKYVQELEHRVAQRTQELEQKNQMVELLLRELNHRVLNNLIAISSVLSTEKRNTQETQTQQALDQVIQRVKNLSNLHQKLMYSAVQEYSIPLKPYIEQIIEAILGIHPDSFKSIKWEKHIAPIQVSQKDAYFIGFTLHELMTNCFKYAFHKKDIKKLEVYLHLFVTDDCLYLHFGDNGKGFPKELFTSQGDFDYAKMGTTNLGLKLLDIISAIYQGHFKIYAPVSTRPVSYPGAFIEMCLKMSVLTHPKK